MRKHTKIIIVLTILAFIAATLIPSVSAATASIAPKIDPKVQAAQHAKFAKASGTNPVVRFIQKVPTVYKVSRRIGVGIINQQHFQTSTISNADKGSNQPIFNNIIIGVRYYFK